MNPPRLTTTSFILAATAVIFALSSQLAPAQERSKTKISTQQKQPLREKTILTSPDLPPIGRSVFDHLIANQKTGKGKTSQPQVPYPFEKLLDLVKANIDTDDQHPISVLMFPFGRSLQRFAAAPNYFKYPRIVVSANNQSKLNHKRIPIDLRGKLYLGFVEPTNSLEVISYNEAAGRFEYQIVKDYRKGGKPKVYYPPRKLCTTCHEGEIPIFPGEPWTESNDNDLLADAMIQARGGKKTYFGYPIKLKDMKGRIFSKEAMKFDFAVIDSGRYHFALGMVKRICPGNGNSKVDCLATGLKVAFATQFNHWPSPDWKLLKDYSKIIDQFYKNNKTIPVPFPIIPDRDPVNNEGVFGISDKPPTVKWRFESMQENQKLLEYNIRLLPSYHDPKVSRVQLTTHKRKQCQLPLKHAPVPYQKYCQSGYFSKVLSTRDMIYLGKMYSKKGKVDFKLISAAIDKMAAAAKKKSGLALSTVNLQRSLLLKELMEQSPAKASPEICCQDKIKSKPVMLPNALGLSSIFDKNLKQLAKSCGECHSQTEGEYPIQFLNGKTESELKAKITLHKDEIIACLQDQQQPMPPLGTVQHRDLKAKTRSGLIRYLEKLSTPAPHGSKTKKHSR